MLTHHRPPSVLSQDDPLSLAMRPPASETDAQRQARLLEEANAQRLSDLIDEQLKQDKKKFDKAKEDVKLLLLGQAESGKSTLQKQFQLMYSPETLEKERASWRAVIYFNVARSVKRILEAVDTYSDLIPDGTNASTLTGSDRTPEDSSGEREGILRARANTLLGGRHGSPPVGTPLRGSPAPPSDLANSEAHNQLLNLKLRLSPVVAAESTLANRLTGGVSVAGSGKGSVFVRKGWQFGGKFGAKRRSRQSMGSITAPNQIEAGRRSMDSDLSVARSDRQHEVSDELVEEIAQILEASLVDIRALWESDAVQKLISRRRLRMEEWAEYFIRDITRISAHDYVPTIDDILHARIQTMGVAEHVFDVPLHGRTVTWHLFDVGGARGQRHTWVPFFDDANAIIFVAPISAFDQYLEEDPRTNRIDDSLQLFTQICSNPLLKHVHLVLFLNKVDVLQSKIASGMRVNKYITSYGQRANDPESVMQYFRAHFLQVHRRNNEQKRVLYTHFTSVVDTKTTRSIIANVRDSIFRGYLKSAALV
ncbi:G-alpha-domain-containing protein [Stereum hirsutum FP-91666 SS1]|uniref:G-alpha-domain-containing protein n=1 Tax=Stereum hirsutum (strain FP-91666) TaxID=721885 RepID=UPI000440E327|nr:G-alpha-domain-containing protein [Stereum hirsutum FP-91666 SS1]EIM90839.1 G-alpha-domain-containing protein [Stereum hirsutum FP-91666 SS1]